MASILSKKKKKKKKKKNKREKYSISELKTLGHQLLSSRAHINNLPLLMSFVCSGTSPPYYALEALLSVQSFFTPILPDLPSHPQGDPQDPEFIYRTWLRSKFDDFVNSLIDIAVSPQSKEALRLHSTVGIEIFLDLLVSKYFNYIDIRYFTYITIEKLARTLGAKDISDNKIVSVDGNNKSHSRTSVELPIHKIYRILSHIPPLEGTDEKAEHEMWNGSGVFIKEGDHKEHSRYPKADDKQNKVLSAVNIAKKMKLKFTKAWISFLRLPLPVDLYKEVLVTLHQAVIPYLSNPIMLCDFLTRSYDIGGVISVMALSSLYILMTQHGLEYPNFYEKLFALLVPSIFMAKHRAKFFELLDSCLKSPLLPAYLAAAFAKKLSRLSLSVPPSGALVIIALIHNLLRRHPSINCLVHRENGDGTSRDNSRVEDGETEDSCTKPEISTEPEISSKKSGIDHFNNEESNPVKTDAMRSSLWEIDTLRHHYCPPVSRFVLSLENDLTVRSKTTEVAVKDFSSGSYATIFRAEIGRRVKQVPLAFYKATPSSLFSESDFVGWTFKYKENDELFTSGVDNKNIDISEDHGHGSAKRQRIECL
ncbi:nucleolar complex protein 4 homolog isoform X1 [Camellia sinensis]|uniref:nucleolar complex protein 4 homolog isoform X1 n=1 Tax=Camellia sinensis TaxID=4442 RepID=UPI001035D76F|nr:nucleolar complex protein 4 homolog isoform X1 [Camellia sinensis]